MAGSAPIVIRRASGDRKQSGLAADLEGQLRSPLLQAVPVTVRARQAAPTGTVRVFKIGEEGDSTEDIVMTAGGVYVIPHGIKGPVRGRLVVAQSAQATLCDVDPTTLNQAFEPERFMAVETSADCTYRLLVY